MAAYIFDYALNSGIALFILFLGYRISLYKNNNFAWSRVVLLSIYLFTMLLPLLHFNPIHTETASIENNGVEIGELTVVQSSEAYVNRLINMLIPTYFIGAGTVTLLMLIGWCKIAAIMISGQKIKKQSHTLVLSPKTDAMPFNIGHFVVIPRNDIGNEAIIAHELSHVRHLHCIDLLLTQAFMIFQWWNPAAWFMLRTLKTVHEYQADDDTLAAGVSKSEYQTLIVSRACRTTVPYVNTLVSGNLRNRLRMMNRRNKKSSLIMFISILPFSALSFCMPTFTFAKDCEDTTELENLFSSPQEETVSISYVSENAATNHSSPQYTFNISDASEQLLASIKKQIRYPYNETNASGKAVIQFSLTSSGKTKDVNIIKSSGVAALDNEAKRVVSELTMTSPISIHFNGKGATSDIRFSIPISFAP